MTSLATTIALLAAAAATLAGVLVAQTLARHCASVREDHERSL